MIRIACPHCQRRYRTQTEGMGKTAVCTGCHQTFRIGQVRLPFEWKQVDLGEDSWIGVEAPKEKKELRNCIICQAPMDGVSVVCPECGANQVTGVARRPQPRPAEVKPPFWSFLPLRLIAAVAALAAIGLGGYFSCRAVTRTAVESGEKAAHMATARQAADRLGKTGDESVVAAEFSGRVDDQNLPLFLDMLSAERGDIRRAALLLIGCGNVTNIQPLLDLAKTTDAPNEGLMVLEAIGPRRLATLSNHEKPEVRQGAAKALCLLSGLKAEPKTLDHLAEATSLADKITRLNELSRPYPAATGRFSVSINETEAPFAVGIEQVGAWFYLRVGQAEFHTAPGLQRTFEIPIERWCVATGVALDTTAIRRMLAGSIQLVSPVGASWRGRLTVTAKTRLDPPLPGFLPITPPAVGQTTEAEIVLTRLP